MLPQRGPWALTVLRRGRSLPGPLPTFPSGGGHGRPPRLHPPTVWPAAGGRPWGVSQPGTAAPAMPRPSWLHICPPDVSTSHAFCQQAPSTRRGAHVPFRAPGTWHLSPALHGRRRLSNLLVLDSNPEHVTLRSVCCPSIWTQSPV